MHFQLLVNKEFFHPSSFDLSHGTSLYISVKSVLFPV